MSQYGFYKIEKSKITSQMHLQITKRLINNCWSLMLKEVDYAAAAINLIESTEIYKKDKLLIDTNDSIIKPDHTAARGFVSKHSSQIPSNFSLLSTNFNELHKLFHPLTGTTFSVIILQMLGANLAQDTYSFPQYHATGTNLFFDDSDDIIVKKTKHFVSNQDIDELPPEIRAHIIDDLQDYKLPIDEKDWQYLQKIYAGETLSSNELEHLNNNLPNKVFNRSWNISYNTSKLLEKETAEQNKAVEYTYSAYLRGSFLNHGTWRISDIFKGYGILQHLGTNPVPIRGLNSSLEQTAGMATHINYTTKENKIISAPGAFLEIASRPYMLINNNNEAIYDDNKNPILFKEVKIELNSNNWTNDKIFLSSNGDIYTLKQLNSGIIANNTMISNNGFSLCYEGFKESNAKGIFFAAGGNHHCMERK